MHGPDPAGSELSELPSLWPWENQLHPHESFTSFKESQANKFGVDWRRKFQLAKVERGIAMCKQSAPSQYCKLNNATAACRKKSRRCSVLGTAACEAPNWTPSCRGLGAQQALPSSGCTHPACVRVAHQSAAYSGQFTSCAWDRGLLHTGKTEAFCAHSLLPWATATELNITVVDFTPNYICDADAIQRMYRGAAGHPERLRFILVMRDPIMRAYSEWSMFSLGWNWDAVKNFSASMAYKLKSLQDCNRTLYMRPQLLKRLPTAELAKYVRKCFAYGRATMYPTTSMYGVCMLRECGRIESPLQYGAPCLYVLTRIVMLVTQV